MKKIDSIQNEYIKNIIKLKSKDEFIFIVEGINLVEQCLEHNIVKEIIFTKEWEKKFASFTNAILVSTIVMKKISSVKTPQGIIAVCYKKQFSQSKKRRVLLLDDIQDPGNLGTIIRTAASFGFDKIITSNNSVSLFNQKVLRSTQGSFLYIEYLQADLMDEIYKLKNDNFNIVGTFLNKTSNFKSINYKNASSQKIALLLGNESNGINYKYRNNIDYNIKLETNKMESLNLSVAGSIIMYLLK